MVLWCLIQLVVIWCSVCIISCSSLIGDFDSECDVFYNNSCFKLIQSPMKSWGGAIEACNDIGGDLTSIHSEDENEMSTNLVEIRNIGIAIPFTWIGLNTERYNDASTWVDGSPVTYRVSIPNIQDSHCITISNTRSWNFDSCFSSRQYICRKTGSGFAIKQQSGTYQYITTDDTINTLPTTLACRTDSHPQTQHIMWEYKSPGSDIWSSIPGNWNLTFGISELTVTENGFYRCNVTTGGNEQMYTASTAEFIPTTISTTQILHSTSTGSSTTASATSIDDFFMSKRNIGIIAGLIAFILLMLLFIVIIPIALIICCKRMKQNVRFKPIHAEESQVNNAKSTEAKIEQYSGNTKQPVTRNYMNLSEVIDQMYEQPDSPSSNDYVPMSEVTHTVKKYMNEPHPYKNLENMNSSNPYQEFTSQTPTIPQAKTFSDKELRKKFKLLNTESVTLLQHQQITIANEPGNKPRNPLENILPYDNNRVILVAEDGENNYINASYMNEHQFIVTMHPTQNTLPDFLQMIHQTNASLVVILTTKNELSEIEFNISKRMSYWGKQGSVREYKHYVIKTTEVNESTNTMTQTLILHNAIENSQTTFQLIISMDWDDKADHTDLESIVKLAKMILSHKNETTGLPIVIHCVDSIGRSGVLVTVLKAIEEMEQNGKVEVDAVLQQLRNERSYFVPTLTHYTSCYSILNEYYRPID